MGQFDQVIQLRVDFTKGIYEVISFVEVVKLKIDLPYIQGRVATNVFLNKKFKTAINTGSMR